MASLSRKAANLIALLTLASGSICLSGTAQAGTVILEGSDSIGFHCGYGQTAACDYTNQTFTAIGGSDSRPIAVVGSTTSGVPVVSATHAIVDMVDLSTAGSLSGYSAILFLAGGGCCDSSPADMAGREADVAAYVNAGGTVEIGNYDGNAGWDFLTGGTGNVAFVAGIGGALGGPGCTDGETVNALGLLNGFTQPGPVGCWTHQAYSQAHFAALGFTLSFFDADPQFALDNPGFGPFSSLLSNGSTNTGTAAPEPASIALLGVGLLGLVALRRKAA
jgi:hypothetical protein